MTILDNSMINAPADAIDDAGGGVISGNYIGGGGYNNWGEHPDGIWVTNTSGPAFDHRELH